MQLARVRASENGRKPGLSVGRMADPSEPRDTFAFTLGLERLGLIALKSPALAAVLVVLLSVIALAGVLRLKVDDSLSELFRTDTPEFRQYEEIDKRFPSSEYDVLVVVEGRDLLKRPQLEAFAADDRGPPTR